MKKLQKVIVLSIILLLVLASTVLTPKVHAASNPYPTWQTVGGVGTIPCTYYAWQQAYDRLGISLPSWGNAINWYYNAANAGYGVGSTAKANSIAVWSIDSDSYGHVAFVTAVNGSQMTINEGGRTDKPNTQGIVNGQVLPATVGSTWYGRTLVGFVYLDGTGSSAYENLGDNFYAFISHPASGYGLNEVGNNVELGKANASSSYWRFVRQSDGSYKIYSTNTGGLLDVSYADTADGTNIAVCASDTGSRAQNWYLVKQSGGYMLLSGLCNKVVDITAASTSIGANAQLYTINCSEAQIFTITKECKHPSYSSTVTKQPTCTSTGTKKYTCTICGYSYTSTISKKDHNYNTTTSYNPSCSSQGYTKHQCSCGASYTDNYKNALGHNYSNGSCTRCGNKPTGVKITTQPKSATAAIGSTVKTTVKATGDGLTYQWFYTDNASDKTFSQSSITTATYSTQMNSARNGRKVYCVITDKYGNSVKTNSVTISIKKTAKITTQPKSVTVANGSIAKATVKATGDSLTYKWYYKDKNATKYTLSTTFTGNSYAPVMNSVRDGRKVYCVITDQYGNSVKTNTVTLSMKKVAKITTQPKSVTVASGSTAKATVKATGEGLTYQWYYKDKNATKYTLSTTFTGNSYAPVMNSVRDGRKVYCVITDKYGNTVITNVVTLSMKKVAKITTQPKGVTVANGTTAKVTAKATGDGLKYQWYYKSATASGFTKSSNTTATYSTTMNTARNGYKVYCVITDQYGNKVTTNTVTLNKK